VLNRSTCRGTAFTARGARTPTRSRSAARLRRASFQRLARAAGAWLAERVIARRAAVKATDRSELEVDLTLVMAGFDFEAVWNERRTFVVDAVEIPVARLIHIVTSKHTVGRDKDRLFLATHREALEELLRGEERKGRSG